MQKQADKNHLTVHIVRELKVFGNFSKESHNHHIYNKNIGHSSFGNPELTKTFTTKFGLFGVRERDAKG